MNTSRSTIALDQYEKDMTAYTYIQNTVNSIRLQGVGQIDNDHGAKILAALRTMIQTYEPVMPYPVDIEGGVERMNYHDAAGIITERFNDDNFGV